MKSPKSLNDLIIKNKAKSKLGFYQQQSQVLNDIRDLLSNIIGDNIAQNLTVSNYKNSILSIETHSAPIANRLKQLHSQLLSHFRQNFDAGLVTINIKVNPKATRTVRPDNKRPPVSERKTIPQHAVEKLLELAEKSDGDLQQRLLKLANLNQNKD